MIIKVCKKHGDLTENDAHKEKSKRCKSGFMWRCNRCKLEKDRRWKKDNWEQHKESASTARDESRRLYREGKTDVIPKANLWIKNDRATNPEKYKEWAKIGRERLGPLRSVREISRVRGMTAEEYYEIEGRQQGLCAICCKEETRKSRNGGISRLCLDHNHSTGQVRELLCHACNQVIGHSKESIEILLSAIEYLKKHQ